MDALKRRFEEWRGVGTIVSIAVAAIGILLITQAGIETPWVVVPTAVAFLLALLFIFGPTLFAIFLST